MSYDVVCIGAANLDTIAVVDDLPGSDERTTTHAVMDAGGGPAGTAAVAMARLGLSVAYCGVVGDDAAGDEICRRLEAEGVDTRWVTRIVGSTPRSMILVERATAARSIVASIATPPRVEDIPLDHSAWLHVDQTGYAPAAEALRLAGGGPRLSVDGGNPIADLVLDVVSLYAPTRSAIGRRYPGTPVEDAMRTAHAEGADDVVVTDGSEGAFALIDGDAVHVPAFDGRIVSTMGAGDVFHGGLVAALVGGYDLSTAVHRASATAMISCRALDGRSGIPTLEELDAFLATPHQGR
ncbi:carbohydrate kinase family protein [Microbacterium sp.]|uniref:carbohydrate kinase family protein n=1 Tax=Microbacterium sp. TaxID=51671 RepID=UPI002C060CAE|nr:carbohydrate kinase family protein [Microbacterium sp.]HWK76861.1 carbohydrate kinase family protein [Microbacterium sp.]